MSTPVHNSTTSFTDRSTWPQYDLIPSSVRSDRNCVHVLVRLIKTRHVSASLHSSLTLQTSKKYPSVPPSMPLRKNRSKRKKRRSSTHTDWHRLTNRLLSPNPLLKMMPHRKTHRLTTLSQRARCPLSMLHMWLLYDPMRGRPAFIPSWFDRTAHGIVVERTGYKRNNSYWTPIERT